MYQTAKTRRRRAHRVATAAALAGLLATAAACSSGSGGGSQVAASATQTIVLAAAGLGSEGDATKAAIASFEQLYPNIKVQLLSLSSDENDQYQQITQRFTAHSATPDVIAGDVIWTATFAEAGWVQDLSGQGIDTKSFFPGQLASGEFNGKLYAVPWFVNAEGIYYRTDLVKSPPTTPADLVADAKAAKAADPALQEGFAWEGDKYEGSVTALVSFMGGFGGNLNPKDLNTPANQQTLQYMYDLVHSDAVTPQAALGWQESNVQDAWTSGQTAFAMNWPYLYQLSEASGSTVAGKTAWIPFPSAKGSPTAALGGDNLMVNAKSTHQAAALKLIDYLTSDSVQDVRATAAGDPPSVQSAYNSQLYATAPYYQQEKAVFAAATPRPVSPVYPQMSTIFQTMISAVLSGQQSPSAALASAQTQINQIPQ